MFGYSAKHPVFPPEFPAAWAMEWGEDVYGLLNVFEVKGVQQKMRGIYPGWFDLRSP